MYVFTPTRTHTHTHTPIHTTTHTRTHALTLSRTHMWYPQKHTACRNLAPTMQMAPKCAPKAALLSLSRMAQVWECGCVRVWGRVGVKVQRGL